MKKYRLKEEVKKYLITNCTFVLDWYNDVNSFAYWAAKGFGKSALEEVPQRVELDLMQSMQFSCSYVMKVDCTDITQEEKDLCERALNGELLDIDRINDGLLVDIIREQNCTDTCVIELIGVIKEYVKRKKL